MFLHSSTVKCNNPARSMSRRVVYCASMRLCEVRVVVVSDDNGAKRSERTIWNFIKEGRRSDHSTRRRTNSAREPTNNSHASPTNNAPRRSPSTLARRKLTYLSLPRPPQRGFVTGNTRTYFYRRGGRTAWQPATSLEGRRRCQPAVPLQLPMYLHRSSHLERSVTFRLINYRERPSSRRRKLVLLQHG